MSKWIIYRKTVKNKSTHYSIQAILENVPEDGLKPISIRGGRKKSDPNEPWFWVSPELLERMRKLLVQELAIPKEDWNDYVRMPWGYATEYIRTLAESLDKKGAVRRIEWSL